MQSIRIASAGALAGSILLSLTTAPVSATILGPQLPTVIAQANAEEHHPITKSGGAPLSPPRNSHMTELKASPCKRPCNKSVKHIAGKRRHQPL